MKVGTNFKISALGFEPVLDVAFGISGEAEHEISLDLQLIYRLNSLMDLEVVYNHIIIKIKHVFIHMIAQQKK